MAYYTGAAAALDAEALRAHARGGLPEYMVPAAFVRLDALPLTPNGKVDRKALPAPDGAAYVSRAYEAPRGAVELALADIWADVLKRERVGRDDNFFELGRPLAPGDDRDRADAARRPARGRASLFTSRTLAELAARSAARAAKWKCRRTAFRRRVADHAGDAAARDPEPGPRSTRSCRGYPGGAANVQDIYPLAPLQEGILFHHLMEREGDAYLLPTLLGFASREALDRFVETLQAVVDRHDILRTAVVWEGLDEPVQVVQRQAALPVETVVCDGAKGEAAAQLRQRYDPRHYRIDVRQAPLLRGVAASDPDGDRWLLLFLVHHLAVDHTTLELLVKEAAVDRPGRGGAAAGARPVSQLRRAGATRSDAGRARDVLPDLLGDIEEPTAPFGLLRREGNAAPSANRGGY